MARLGATVSTAQIDGVAAAGAAEGLVPSPAAAPSPSYASKQGLPLLDPAEWASRKAICAGS